MKNKFYTLMLLIGFLLIGSINILNAQVYECQVIEDDFGYIVYQMRETSGTNTPTTSTVINDITFVIRYPQGAVSTSLICISNDYNIIDGLSIGGVPAEQNFDGYDYFYWNSDAGSGFNPPNNWTVNVWEDICKFQATGATGSGLFTVAINGWDGRGLNWNQTIGSIATDFDPTIIGGGITYSYPTLVYDYVWTGASNTQWDKAENWLTECGDVIATAPNIGNNCFIPSGLSNYPNEVNLAQYGGHQPTCTDLKIASGASLTLDDQDVTNLALIWNITNLTVDGVLASIPKSSLTVTGTTTINSAEGIVVQATSAGVGSFIDNGITYGANGTAKVQTYLTNSAGVNNFDIHLIGPTVNEENYTGNGAGAYLEEFILDGVSTYAYEWDESVTNNGDDAWINLSSLTDEIYTAKGIGLSAIDNNNHTLEMTGALMTGNISSPALTYTNNHYELISNPYPSAIDFDGLAGTDNSALVQNKYWIWNPAGNNYIANANPYNGDEKYIQVGQGFFVETKTTGTFDFTNTRRVHSNVAFRDIIPNKLIVKAFGGQANYEDKLSVRFDDEATSGYDIEIEAKKWASQNDDATQIWTIAADNKELSINVLPTSSLTSGMTSVPMNFSCGYNTEYTLSFFDIESFETGTEIWLEDKLTGDDWISINDNPDYVFTATADDLEDRFVLHFFGPTGVDEFEIGNTVDIFSYRQNAFVRNNTNEIIKEVNIYTLAGELLQSNKPSDLKLNKYWVSNNMGYYVVRVITDKNVYTEKVFISK